MAVSDRSKSTSWLPLSKPEHKPFAFPTRAAAFVYDRSEPIQWVSWLGWTSYLHSFALNSCSLDGWACELFLPSLPRCPGSLRPEFRGIPCGMPAQLWPPDVPRAVQERGWAGVADERHLSSCKPPGVTHGHFHGRASAVRGLLHIKVVRTKPTGMHPTLHTKPGMLLKV